MSADLPYRPRRRFSALTRRILAFNAIALLILLGGVLWVQSNRIGLVEERIAGIRDQALIVAGARPEYHPDPAPRRIQPEQGEPLLRPPLFAPPLPPPRVPPLGRPPARTQHV